MSQVLNAKIAYEAQKNQSGPIETQDFADPNCVANSGGTVTYTNCDWGTGTIDGTISVSGSTITVDLSIATTDTTIDMDGDITVTDIAITGSLAYAVNITANGTDITWTISGDYDITLSNGCATGGTLIIDGSWDIPNAGSQSTKVKATFGPNCGDVELT